MNNSIKKDNLFSSKKDKQNESYSRTTLNGRKCNIGRNCSNTIYVYIIFIVLILIFGYIRKYYKRLLNDDDTFNQTKFHKFLFFLYNIDIIFLSLIHI